MILLLTYNIAKIDLEKSQTPEMPLTFLYIMVSHSEFQEQGQKAIDVWRKLHNSQSYKIKITVRNLLRNVASFIPEAGSICPELTLHILTTTNGWTRCLYHSYNRTKKNAQNDTLPGKRSWKLTGTPYSQDKTRKVMLEGGILHCGCEIKNALMDFYLFKTGRLWSPSLKASESWWTQRNHPQVRELILTSGNLSIEKS